MTHQTSQDKDENTEIQCTVTGSRINPGDLVKIRDVETTRNHSILHKVIGQVYEVVSVSQGTWAITVYMPEYRGSSRQDPVRLYLDEVELVYES